MPPKKADPKGKEPAPVVVEEKELCFVLKFYDLVQSTKQFKARLFCPWLDCCTLTETFGGASLPWDAPPEAADSAAGTTTTTETEAQQPSNSERTVTLKFEHSPGIVSNDAISNFNANPTVYVVLLEQQESRRVPASFLAVDCSEFLLSEGRQTRRTDIIDGVVLELTVLARKSLLPPDVSTDFDPMVVSFNRLSNYPKLNHPALNSFEGAFNQVYLYGLLDFGSFQRSVFARAMSLNTTEGQVDDESKPLNACFNISTCILPGLGDLSVCHEKLMATTFSVQLYDEDLNLRAFHARNIDEYNTLIGPSAADPPANAAPAAPAGKGKDSKAAPPKKGAATEAVVAYSPLETMTIADRQLLKCITNALTASSKIYTHGCIRFRLDPLLSSSEDLLTEFRRRREGAVTGDNRVVVKDSVLAEVKLEKPSKPIKWTMPTDISIKKMLQQAKEEEQSKLDGTLAVQPSTIAANSRPRYEMFFESGTCIKMNALLIRKLAHPKPLPSVFASTAPLPTDLTTTESPKKGSPQRRGSAEKRRGSADKRRGSSELSPSKSSADDEARKQLLAELQVRLKHTPFARMVFVFRYDDDVTLNKINDALIKVNSRALPDIQGTLRSYSFSKAEADAARSAELDVVTGFTIIDDDVRIVVCEGLAGPGLGMQSMFVDIPRLKEDDKNLKLLCNPEVLFPSRLYTEFGPDLKRIRVRDKLKKLARKPELYNRKQVEELTFSAVENIMSLRRAPDMQSTKTFSLYPSAEALNNLELLYGEAISIADLDGAAAEAQRKLKKASLVPVDMADADPLAVRKVEIEAPSHDGNDLSLRASRKKMYGDRRCAPTDSRNEAFERYLASKSNPENQKDFLEENRELRRLAWERMLLKKAELDNELSHTLTAAFGKDPSKCKVYMYSQQKLNYAEHAIEELRKTLAKVKDASFTYNKDFNSQTMSTLVQLNRPDPKGEWLTPSGFQYPKPKSTKELIAHPKKPSQARIEDLQEPYDNSFLPNSQQDPELLEMERGFTTRFRAESKDFLNLEAPVYARDFQLKLVGDKSKLPRGVLTQGTSVNKDFFRSVHLGGDDALKIMEEAIAQEKKDWQDKVVVDHNDFKVGGFKVRDTPVMVDRIKDILKDEPKTKALKALRTMKSCSGRDISYGPTPIGLMTKEEYVPNALGKALLRTKDETKFVTMTEETRLLNRRPTDFTSYINKDEYASKLARAVAKRKHLPINHHLSNEAAADNIGSEEL